MMDNIPLIAAGAGLFGLLIAFMLYMRVNKVKIDNDTVADITVFKTVAFVHSAIPPRLRDCIILKCIFNRQLENL